MAGVGLHIYPKSLSARPQFRSTGGSRTTHAHVYRITYVVFITHQTQLGHIIYPDTLSWTRNICVCGCARITSIFERVLDGITIAVGSNGLEDQMRVEAERSRSVFIKEIVTVCG